MRQDIVSLLPPAVAVAIVFSRAVGLAIYSHQSKQNGVNEVQVHENDREVLSGSRSRFVVDGPTILALGLTRLVCVLALLALSVFTTVVVGDKSSSLLVQISLLVFYCYVALLSCVGICSSSRYWRSIASTDASLCLFIAFVVSLYRNVWPSIVVSPYIPHPIGWISWTTFSLLTVSGFIVPLMIPYVPDKESLKVDEETTRSFFSTLSFSYMDKIVFFAYRHPDVKLEDLPPVPYSHRADTLAELGLHKMDPILVGKRHLFWSMLRTFTADYLYMIFWTVLYAVFRFVGPWAMRNLLSWLEQSASPTSAVSQTGLLYVTEEYVLQPWFWVVLIALSPVMTATIENRWLYCSTLVQVKLESLITQLIFEHSMRIRITTDTKEADDSTANPQNLPTIESSAPKDPAMVANAHTEDIAAAENVPSAHASESTETTLVGTQTASKDGKNAKAGEKDESDSKKSAPLVGKINNLITSDFNQIKSVQEILDLPSAIIQMAVGIAFLYNILGWSALVGLGVFIVGAPAPALIGRLFLRVQKKKMELTDQRVQSVTETMQILRTLKLLAWEAPTIAQITKKRDDELKLALRTRLLDVIMRNTEVLLPFLSSLATFGTYTFIMKQPLNAARAFPALAVFSVLYEQVWIIMQQVPRLLKAKVSFDRFNDFLNNTEILVHEPLENLPSGDSVEVKSHVQAADTLDDRIGFNNISFTWQKSSELPGSRPSVASSMQRFELTIDTEVIFKRGKINLIIGPTASGKTSMLMALLGEMHNNPYDVSSWCNLPRQDGVAYAPQESWVLNATIKENIVFNRPFDESRYKKVLKACSLERDLALWDAGDLTEVGEKGLTLSGGQKARVTLARALYSDASILLLDDPLAALDVHTAKDVANNALRGDLTRGRTVILVTHNIPLAAPIADHVIALGSDGRIVSQGTISEALSSDEGLKALADKEGLDIQEEEVLESPEGDADKEKEKTAAGKLIVEEEKAIGRVEWAAMMLFIGGIGGVAMWMVLILPGFLQILGDVLETWFIGYWASQYEDRDPSEVSALYYLSLYGAIVVAQMGCRSVTDIIWAFRSTRASRIIHEKLVKSILNAPLRWLDVVPVGRIVTRCTQDIGAIDGTISDFFSNFILFTLMLLTWLFTSVYMSGLPALIVGALVASMGCWLGIVYLNAQLNVKREMSNAKSPVISQVGTAVSGITTIRAYGAQKYFRTVLRQRADACARAGRAYFDLNRWIAFRIDLLGGLFSGVVTAFLVFGSKSGQSPSAVGFTLSVVLMFSRHILYWVRFYNILEVECNSLERILDYLRIEQEPLPTESGKPPAYWPSSGHLRIEKLSASYRENGPLVLRDITLEIASGERVGVVGRTGAGKSSVTLALLRAIDTTGKVYYDNIATDTINLDALRSNITLIPQQPELIHGSLRENLDPFGDQDDFTLNDALRSAGLFSITETTAPSAGESSTGASTPTAGGSTIGLDTAIESGGKNLSLGQRQIISLARAILRRSKVLILDEATAAIDYKTDAIIQKSLRTELSKDTTVITIAHRLQTIMDSDKILVLDAGEVAEFDSPATLLKKKDGFLRALVDASDDREKLLGLAGLKLTDI